MANEDVEPTFAETVRFLTVLLVVSAAVFLGCMIWALMSSGHVQKEWI